MRKACFEDPARAFENKCSKLNLERIEVGRLQWVQGRGSRRCGTVESQPLWILHLLCQQCSS